jgi:hypothetical protein
MITVTLMVRRMIIKLPFPDQSLEISAILETFIRVVSNGSMIGKLKIAIREKLLLALEAMAAIIVRIEASPKLPSIRAVRNNGILTTAFPINVRKRIKERPERIAIKSRLYNTFERRMACGLAMV